MRPCAVWVKRFWHGGWFKADWTHEAHVAVLAWLILERPELDLDASIDALWSASNDALGIANTDTAGYHVTITRCFLIGIRGWLEANAMAAGLCAQVNALLLADEGRRDWPLRWYSREQLFSVSARRTYLPPTALPTSQK